MYMLEGSIELEVSGEHFVLKVVDTAQFRVNEPHCLKNPGDVNAVCLWFSHRSFSTCDER